MYYYLVNKTGDGTRLNPFRPVLLSDIPFVCTEVNEQFLVGTNELLTEPQILDLPSFCETNSVVYNDVLSWFVGDRL